MRKQCQWLIFDADNALWDVEALYDRARDEFCKYVALKVGVHNSEDISEITSDAMQRHRDKQLYAIYGYSCVRFARSFEDTIAFLIHTPEPQDMAHVRMIAMDVFYQQAKTHDGLEITLDRLHRCFNLAIVTAGEKWVQERRLQHFHLRHFFKEILVVESKTAEVFKGLTNGVPRCS